MEPFSDLIALLTKILEQRMRPLTLKALVAEVNGTMKDRVLPESTIRMILMKNVQIFVETDTNEWALKAWNPSKMGVDRRGPTGASNPWSPNHGEEFKCIPLNQPLEELTRLLLDHLVPATQDRATLDNLTIFHVSQSTYRPNSLPRETADCNYLVPPTVYESTKNLAWRFPPMLRATFFIKNTSNDHPRLDVRAVFGVGSVLEYQEWRSFGESQRISRRYVAQPEISTPKSFAAVELNGQTYVIREDEQSNDPCRKSVLPVFYETTVSKTIEGDSRTEFEIPEITDEAVIVKKYDETTGKMDQKKIVDLYKPIGLDVPQDSNSPRIALVILKRGGVHLKLSIETERHEDWGVTEITLRLSNEFKMDRSRPDDEFVLLHSAILPHIYLSLTGATCILRPQQHEECLKEVRESILPQQEQFLADLTTQTNCIFTKSTKAENTFVFTPFGVYDTVRVDPVLGPEFSTIYSSIDALIQSATFSDAAIQYLRNSTYRSSSLIAVLRAIQRSFTGPSGRAQRLYAYQWKAIQNRIEILAAGSISKTTVIRAPTGAGKTLVFFANAAIHYLFTGQRAVMTFPTRILNEDMFKRLTRFVFALREELQMVDQRVVERVNGGIQIGTSDPSYNAIVKPTEGQMMIQYDGCPKCQEQGIRNKVICRKVADRLIGVCADPKCGHTINYMAGPNEVGDLLPALTIATPDKLFYEATIRAPQRALRFFGAPCIRCKCGYHISLMNRDGQIGDSVECPQCKQKIDKEKAFKAGAGELPKLTKAPPLYFVLDEIHSMYGMTATLISYFFSLLREMAKSFGSDYEPTFETGTATIANEGELIRVVTHREVFPFPNEEEFFNYFQVRPDRVRYRTLMFLPVGKATRSTLINSIVAGYRANQTDGVLAKSVRQSSNGAYDFLLAYIPRKANGYAVANEVRRLLDDRAITFLSGDAPTARLVSLLQEIFDRKTNLLLANMVISLGIDIPRLNNMVMYGIPQSMTEMVQTVGRTGRGQFPGHIVVHLQPSIPRDEFVFRNFHRVLGDVTGYFDRKPIAAVNTYVANLIFINVLYAMLSTRLAEDYRNTFCDRAGDWLASGSNSRDLLGRVVKEILGRDGTNDLRREVVLTIQPRLRDAIIELATKKDHLFSWIEGRPDALYSLRTRADRVPLTIAQPNLLNEMKRGIARDIRPVEETVQD